MAERSISVRLGARVDSYIAAMRAAQASTTGFSRATQRNLRTVGSQMQTVGRSMTKFVTAPVALMGAAAIKAAVDWESAWAGVTKTVDGTTAQMADLEQGLRQMAKELPATHQEIAAVAEAAGALGVETENIEEFTRVMLDLGETTNLTSDEAATSIAQLMNVMQTAPDAVDNLGATLVDLGNNGASTERDILEMAHRIAGAGELIGLSEAEVLGFANALSSMGIEAQMGGSSISRVMSSMFSAVRSGGDQLRLFAEVAGVTAGEFARVFNEAPAQAVVMFINGLTRINNSGGNVIGTLKDLKLNTIQVRDTILRLVGGGDLLTDSLEMANEAWTENTALTEEAAKRYETAGARLEIVRNKIVDLFIDLGEMILPFVETGADFVADLASAFQSLPAPIQASAMVMAGLVAAAGPLVFLAGGLVKNFVALRGALALMSGPAAALSAAMLGINAALVIGFIAYQGFTQKQRETDQATRETVAALNTQFPALLAAAVAAAEAGEEIDALALSNEMLSMALQAGEADVLNHLAAFNMSAEDLLDVVSGLTAGGGTMHATMVKMAESFGLSHDQAGRLVIALASMNLNEIADNATALAADIGITEEELGHLAGSFFAISDAAESFDLKAITQEFLDNRVAAIGFEDSMVKAAEAVAGVTRFEDPVAVYRALTQVLLDTTDANRELADITPEVQSEMAAITALLPGTAAGFEEAAAETDEFVQSGMAAADAMTVLERAFGGFQRQMLGFNWFSPEAFEQVERFEEAFHMVIDPQRDFVRSRDAVHSAFLSLMNDIEDTSGSLFDNTEEQIANRAAIYDGIDALVAHRDAEVALTGSVDHANSTLESNIGNLRDAAVAAGLNADEVDALIAEYLNVPKSVDTAIKLSGEMYALTRIEEMISGMETIDEGAVAEMEAILRTQGAFAALEYLRSRINSTTGTVSVRLRVPVARVSVSGDGRSVTVGKVGTAVIAQRGAYTGKGSGAIPAVLHHDEAVLPLSRPADMARILGLPQVGPRVAAAMESWMPMHGWSGGGSQATYNVSVNHYGPGETTPQAVVRALREYQRQSGPIPITVR